MPHVKLGKINDTYDSFIQEHVAHPKIAATCNIPFPYPENGAIKWIGKAEHEIRTGHRSTFMIFYNNPPVGVIDLKEIDRSTRSAELGYWPAVEYWNKGIMTEATRQVVYHAFSELKLRSLKSRVLVTNPASYRVLEKNGFVKYSEEIDQSEARFKGHCWNHYCLTRNQWKKRQSEPVVPHG